MRNQKLQAAHDELERLCETVKGYKEQNSDRMPNPDSDAGRAVSLLETFTTEMRKLDIGKVLGRKI
jgi:hypothetical protein